MLDSISGWFIIPELGYLKQQAKKKKKNYNVYLQGTECYSALM